MAIKPCNTCANYDPIIRGKDKTGAHGRCVPRSTYPAVEQAGQEFPKDAVRAEPGELCKPHIVVGIETVKSCELYRSKP
jgi:hypothetical protein